MNDHSNLLEQQVATLVASLQAHRDTRCAELAAQADLQAREMLAEARQQLRARVRLAVVEERRRRDAALHHARQRIQTAQRRRIQARYTELLGRMWPLLVAALEARWSDGAARRQWCELLAGEALTAFDSGPWKIEHPQDWAENDTVILSRLLADRPQASPTFIPEPAIRAGIRIHCAGACLDGTPDGLLSRRTEIEARLLAAWERGASTTAEIAHE